MSRIRLGPLPGSANDRELAKGGMLQGGWAGRPQRQLKMRVVCLPVAFRTPPIPTLSFTHAQISQSRSSQKRGSCQRTWFLLCLLIRIRLNEMQIGLVCVLSNASSFFKGIQRYGHTHWIKCLWLYKQDHNESSRLTWGAQHLQNKCECLLGFHSPGWFTRAARHILSWWPPFS